MLISTAYAQTAGTAGAGGSVLNSPVAMFIQFALIGLVFYFLIIRPQNKRLRDHKAKIEAVKKGDQVVTGGGLIGKVVKVEENVVEVELAQGVKVRALKSTLTDIVDLSTKPAND